MWRVEDSDQHAGMVKVVGTALTAVWGFTIAIDVSEERAAQMRKDAALIAAAPDLLEAATALMAMIDPDGESTDIWCVDMRAALAKAASS